MTEMRPSVEGWRWDFLTPWGWAPSSGVMQHYGLEPEPQGWYNRERATCLRVNHTAPHRDCSCGLHGIEFLTPMVADTLEKMSDQRAKFLERGELHGDNTLIIALSRITLEKVLPTAWPNDEEALAAHPEAVPDPPHTIRGYRKIYRKVFIDREWLAQPGVWPEEVLPEDGVHYVPDLAAWVRKRLKKGKK